MNPLGAWYCRSMAAFATLFRRDEAALAFWQRLRAARPADARVVATIAHLEASRGASREAINLIRQAIELEPGNAASWFNLGFLQQQRGGHEEALRSFERALDLDAKLDRAHYGKALSLLALGRPKEAIAPLERNTELQPMSPYGWYQLAHVHHRLGDRASTARVIRRLAGFEPQVARQLERETGAGVAANVSGQILPTESARGPGMACDTRRARAQTRDR